MGPGSVARETIWVHGPRDGVQEYVICSSRGPKAVRPRRCKVHGPRTTYKGIPVRVCGGPAVARPLRSRVQGPLGCVQGYAPWGLRSPATARSRRCRAYGTRDCVQRHVVLGVMRSRRFVSPPAKGARRPELCIRVCTLGFCVALQLRGPPRLRAHGKRVYVLGYGMGFAWARSCASLSGLRCAAPGTAYKGMSFRSRAVPPG